MNKDLDLNNIINNKIKTEFEQYIAIDQPPPFYSPLPISDGGEKEKEKIASSTKFDNYLNGDKMREKLLMENTLNDRLNGIDSDCKLNKLSVQLNMSDSYFDDLYSQQGQTVNNNQCTVTGYSPSNDIHPSANTQFYQQHSIDSLSSRTANQQSMMINNKISLLNNALKTFDALHPSDPSISQQPTIYQMNANQHHLDQQINEIYQYAASDQFSKSTSIESDAAYSTLKLLDTASCNSSLIGGINGLNNDQLIKYYPPTYAASVNNPFRMESETDSGYTLNGSQNGKAMIDIENDYVRNFKDSLKNRMNHSPSQLTQLQLNQLNQQINSPVDCLYKSNNFITGCTTINLSHDTLDNLTAQQCLNKINKSVSTYSFSNSRPNEETIMQQQFPIHNSYLAYQSPSDITDLSSTPLPGSSTKEALKQQQFPTLDQTTNLVIMTNCSTDVAQQNTMTSIDNNNMQDSFWYQLLSRRLRRKYISKRKIQDSSGRQKKSKFDLDSLDQLEDKKTITLASEKSTFRLAYQFLIVKRCQLVPCLLIFACALLLFVIGLFTILTCYFDNSSILLNDNLLLTNSHTQIPINSVNKISKNLPPSVQQPPITATSNNFPLFDAFNRIFISLTSAVRGVASSSSSSLANSLTTGDSTINKHAPQTESQIRLKQYQINHWYKSAIFYEIFVASFQDSNEDGIGDLNGLINRLHYIKELGVTAIRLNSIYSVLDYPYQFENILNHTQIDPKLGDINDFRRLVDNCHNMGLRLVLDLNVAVTSDQHRAAHFLNYHNNDAHNYYVNTSDYVPVNEAFFPSNFQNYKDQLDEQSNTNGAFEEVHLTIGGHLFLNYSHPFIRNQLIKTIRFWLNEGVDGFYLTRLHEIQFNQENPEHLIQLFRTLKHEINIYGRKTNLNSDFESVDLDEEDDFSESNSDQPAKILIASRESLDHLHKRLKRTLIDFWTQEIRKNDASRFQNLYPTTMQKLHNNNTRSNRMSYFNASQSISYVHSIDSTNADNRRLTLNQFINHYFQSQNKHRHQRLKSTSGQTMRNHFNIYSYFNLVDTFLDLRLNGSEQIRDQINGIYLANTIDDELFKDSNTLSVHSSIVLWSIGDHTRPRLANRLHLNSVLVAQFILSILPGSISLFYGDEIGLRNAQNANTAKFKNGQLVPMAWSSRGLYANFTNSSNSNINNEPLISNNIVNLDNSVRANIVNINNSNKPWLPISIDQLVHRNTEKLQEQIQRIQHLLQFRKQYLSIMNWNMQSLENVHHHQPSSYQTNQLANSFQNNNQNSDQAKSVHQTYMFHYVNNGEIVFERYYQSDKGKRRYVLFANLSNVTRMNDFSDKFYFGTIKVASNVKRLRDFLYLNSLQLESAEALIAIIE